MGKKAFCVNVNRVTASRLYDRDTGLCYVSGNVLRGCNSIVQVVFLHDFFKPDRISKISVSESRLDHFEGVSGKTRQELTTLKIDQQR